MEKIGRIRVVPWVLNGELMGYYCWARENPACQYKHHFDVGICVVSINSKILFDKDTQSCVIKTKSTQNLESPHVDNEQFLVNVYFQATPK